MTVSVSNARSLRGLALHVEVTVLGREGSRAQAGLTEDVGAFPPGGNSCYHSYMAKTQLGVRVDPEVKKLAQARAKDRGLDLGDYIARLVRDDAEGLRQRGLDAARRFLDEHQQLFDEAEDADLRAPGAHAA